jgi:adenosylhomocysteine nucleosidase
VLIIETGVGQAKVAQALDWLLTNPQRDGIPYRPQRLIFAGFAGALTEPLQVGDIVVADEVIDRHGRSFRTTWPGDAADTSAWHRGKLLTVDELTATPEDRRRLAEEHQAIAVEMESAVFASRCTQAGIPFGCVRAISDEAATTLSPALMTMLSGGSVSPWRALLALGRRPWMLPELLRLARDTRKASEQLGNALESLLKSS